MPDDVPMLVQVLRAIVLLTVLGPFGVNVFFLVRSLRSNQRERLRWQVPHLFVSLGWSIGLALTVLVREGYLSWFGVVLLLVCGVADVWLIRAEHRATS
jgi:hypothetical protein